MPTKEESDPEYCELLKEVEDLKQKLETAQQDARDEELNNIVGDLVEAPKLKLIGKRVLRAHIQKVNGVDFAGSSRLLVSGALDGKLMVWDTGTGNKIQIIPLRSSWVMAVAFAPSGRFIASGGMDNCATVHDVKNRNERGETKIVRELGPFDGFLSSCKFLNDTELVTGSGDMKLCRWDLTSGRLTAELLGHSGDVMSMSLHPTDPNIIITGSVDQSAKLWDLRTKTCQQTFFGHSADVNSVHFHSSGYAFATASEDFTARLFDIRSDQQVNEYGANEIGFTSTVLSKSGRYLLAGGLDGAIHSWDVLTSAYVGSLIGHEDRVTALSLSDTGIVLASASWDQNIRLWM